jgi:hypothetical protein
MTPEDKKRIEEYTAEIAKILYRNAEAKNAEQLKTLEGIEIAVRDRTYAGQNEVKKKKS